MNILILTQYYPPETGAPQNRLHSLALNLKLCDVNVNVLTAMPNYPKMEIFEGYKGIKRKIETIEGIEIVRTSIYVSKSKGLINRLINYFSFVWSSALSVKMLKPVDFILCESPPLFLGISAIYLSRRLNAKLIFNVSDLWPESAEKLSIVKNRLMLRLAYMLEAYIYKKSFLVTGQTQGIVNDINERFPNVPTYWLPNGVDKELYLATNKKDENWISQYNLQEKNLYIYAGIIGHAQGLEVIMKAKQWLIQNAKNECKNIEFVIIGDGPEIEKLKKLNEHLNTKIIFISNVSKQKVISMLKSATACIVPLKKLDLFLGAIPSKIFDPLALSIPILLGVDGEARKIFIEQANGGLYFEPENEVELAKSVLFIERNPALSKKMGADGCYFVEQHFDRKNIALSFKMHIDKLNGLK
jgi:glycosyltransferase involved in cell wall biosynthesis